jgi:chromate transporter
MRILVLATHRFTGRARAHPIASGFLDGVNAAAIGAFAAAVFVLGRGTLVSPALWVIALVAVVVLLATRINPTWLIAAGALAGWLLAA